MKLIDVVNGPWAITPDMLGEIQNIYRAHVRGPKIDIPAVEAKLGRPLKNEAKSYQVIDGVAVLEVSGPIARRMNLFMEISGGTSSELMRRDFIQALDDPTVKGIVMAINSPGGTVDGSQELAETIFSRRGEKPVIAVAEGLMASAAYWIGAAADAVYISEETAMIGSIGVVARHVDVSKAEEQAGFKSTEITAGRYKRITSQFEPLTTEGRADIQAKVDAIYSVFVDAVAKYRGADVDQVLSSMADGRVFVGRQAIDAGLVDGVSTLEQLIAGINQNKVRAGAAMAAEEGDKIMTLDQLRAENPDLVAQIEATAREGYLSEADLQQQITTARSEGATAERERILGIESQAIAGHDDLIAQLKADGTTSPAEAAVQILAAEQSARKVGMAEIDTNGNEAVPAAEGGDDAVDANAPIEERAKAQWDKDSDLRSEFGGNFDAYLAYAKNTEAGRARVLGKK